MKVRLFHVKNQFVIEDGPVTYFQSYYSIIVKKIRRDCGKVDIYLDEYYWNYSKTTSKYRNMFLEETTKETQAKIDSGEYTLTNLKWENLENILSIWM